MSDNELLLSKVLLKSSHWDVIRKYLNTNIKIAPELFTYDGLATPVRKYLEFVNDSDKSWYLSIPHLRDMYSIPWRILIQNGVHTSLDKTAIKNAITGYSPATEELLIREGKDGTISAAQNLSEKVILPDGSFYTVPKGVLIIPYYMPSKDNTIEGIQAMRSKFGEANLTVRTNLSKLRYVRTATNAFNTVEGKKTLTRMPYVPFAYLTPETNYIAKSMLIEDIADDFQFIPNNKAVIAETMENILKESKIKSQRTIFIIEGEKKALALSAACEGLLQSAISASISGKPYKTPPSFEVVGISGVWQTLQGKTEVQPDLLACVNFDNADVVLMYDNDIRSNLQVVNAMAMLASGLKQAGASSVSMVYPSLPTICSGQEKLCKGFDDTVTTIANVLKSQEYSKYTNPRLSAQLLAMDHILSNIVPIKTTDLSAKQLKSLIAPYYSQKGSAPLVMDLLADRPDNVHPSQTLTR